MLKFSIVSAGAILMICCIVACKKDGSGSSAIVGRWKLQQVNVGYYRNDTLGLTQNFNTSSSFVNYIQFNGSGSFADGYVNGSLTDTTTGNYTVSNNILKFSNLKSTFFGQVNVTPFPVFYSSIIVTTVADSAKITQITNSNLTIEGVITSAEYYDNGIFNVNKQVYTQYYSR
jgi:hypothetical protein